MSTASYYVLFEVEMKCTSFKGKMETDGHI